MTRMTPPIRPTFGQDWPANELEQVSECPLCRANHSGENHRVVAADQVQDWSFRAAPGRWTYWRCKQCQGLVLNPRPTRLAIAHAYQNYYTHHADISQSSLTRLKTLLRHEAWAMGWNVDLPNRLHWGAWAKRIFAPLARRAYPGFVIHALGQLPRGKLLDVGCGNGRYLEVAQQLGHVAMGLDPDPAAVSAVRARGLAVQVGGFETLANLPQDFDVVVASHVLEHAHEPMQALGALLDRLKPGGHLVLALPNATSPVFDAFGPHWRGLEAPRHIAIAARAHLVQWLTQAGHATTGPSLSRHYTWAESADISRANNAPNTPRTPASSEPDLIEILVQKAAALV